jgi:uncharacterized protein involved in outer membrane biogenesis
MIKKILAGIGILLLLVLASAVLIPILFKDKIIAKVKTEINNNLNAKVNFGDFDISILRNFPHLSFSMEKLSVAGVQEFEGDTLTSLDALNITVNLMSVISGDKIKIRSIELDHPRIHALVLKNGKANWDIVKPSPEDSAEAGESSEFRVELKKFEIREGRIVYQDDQSGMSAQIFNLNHTLRGDFTQDNFVMETRTTADAATFTYGGVPYLSRAKADIKADLEADMPNMKFTFKDNVIKLNELALAFEGFVAMPGDDISMDVKFGVKESEFRNFISLIPAIYSKDFSSLKTSGRLAFAGAAKGTYSESRKTLPAFSMSLQIEDGMFRYPSLPAAVNNVQVDLKINNPDGVEDHTVINLSRMHAEMGSEPFDARLLVKTPVSDPQFDAAAKGNVNLGNLQQVVPLEKGTTLAGTITADFSASGRMSQVEQQKYEEVKADGQIGATGIRYASADFPGGVEISRAQLTFTPKNVALNTFDGKMGTSDFHLDGTLDNFIAYALKQQTLKGTLNFSSTRLNINELTGNDKAAADQPAAEDTAALSVVEVPGNIDFVLNSKIGTLLYDNLTIQNVSGALVVRDQQVKMDKLAMQMLDGSVTMNGTYGTRNIRKPEVSFDLSVNNCDIQKTAATFVTVKKMAPIAERCTGKYSTQFSFAGTLDSKMQPVLPSLTGGGKLSTQQVTVSNFEPISKVAEALKMEKYKKMELNNVNLSFEFKEGRVFVKPFDVKIGNTATKISGSNGFDQSIDYTMSFEIPRSEFGGAVNNVLEGLVAQANSKGASLSLGEKVNVDALIGGTVSKPSVKLAMKGSSGKGMVDDLKNKAKEELDKKKAELEAKAKEEAERLRKDAETRVKAETDKAKAEAERLKKEAEAKARAEAEKARKEAEEKAKKAAEDRLKKLLPR